MGAHRSLGSTKTLEVFTNNASKAVLFDVINNAQESIQIGMMVWTNQDLANAVISAHKRGVVVEVLAQDLGGVLPSLMKAGISVIVNPKLSFMHNKFMYVDGKVLVNGSANWSVSSFTRNDESFVVVRAMSQEQQELMDAYWEYLTGS
jgi:phosphatidylserine/phosphatidylglycerophosphate/cardiolipin synthase-like enzyme